MIYVIYSNNTTNCSSYSTTILTIVVNYIYNFYYFFLSFSSEVKNETSSDVPPAIREVLDAFAKPAGQGLQPLL